MNEGYSTRCSGSWCSSLLMLLGRIFIAAIFILAGVGKFLSTAETAAYMTAKGMTMVYFFLYIAALIEIIGGLSLLLGVKTRLGALLLMLFLIPTTYIFHNFWAVSPEAATVEMINFLKNLAIFGGLLYILGVGPGKLSFDALCCRRENKEG